MQVISSPLSGEAFPVWLARHTAVCDLDFARSHGLRRWTLHQGISMHFEITPRRRDRSAGLKVASCGRQEIDEPSPPATAQGIQAKSASEAQNSEESKFSSRLRVLF